jgi:hypothetical protein
MARLIAIAIALVCGVARAENPKLAEARTAIEQVRYDQAQRLLVEALQAGGNSPADVVEIYRLSASTAVVLNQADVGEQYYRRWLALDPQATLSSDIAPTLREPFVAAQAYMRAKGHLDVRVARRTATEIDVVVESDPLTMVTAIALAGDKPVPLGVDRHVRLVAHGNAPLTIVALDELGNHLRELPVGEVVGAPPTEPVATRPLPLWRRWYVWALPAAVCGIASVALGAIAQDLDGEIEARLPQRPFYDDIEQLRTRRDANATAANAAGITAGALAAVAVVVYVTRPKSTVVAPTAGSGAVGVTVTGSW